MTVHALQFNLLIVIPDSSHNHIKFPRHPANTGYNLPPSAGQLAEAVEPNVLPTGTREGLNDWRRTGYGGPCPPIGRHRYFHKLSALDTVLPDLGRPTKAQLEKAMQGHVLAQAELVGTYEKKGH